MTEERKSRWPDKYVEGGTWHRAWQKTLDGEFSVAAIKAFHKGDFRLWHEEMARERYEGMLEVARAFNVAHAAEVAGKKAEDGRVAAAHYGGSLLLDLLLPADVAEDLHASLEDRFPKLIERHGAGWARVITNIQILHVVVGRWATPLATACEFIRRFF
jgi:hypothetical protein